MGLDMYLYAVKLPQRISLSKREIGGGSGKVNETERADYVQKEEVHEVAYWRKVNCVHKWFVQNCQGGKDDCKEYPVSKEQLEQLLEIVIKVLANHNLAMTLLPTQAGFFFGGTDIDEYYFSDLEETKEQLEKVLHDWKTEGYNHFIYRSSW
jgi:hypothetical protein